MIRRDFLMAAPATALIGVMPSVANAQTQDLVSLVDRVAAGAVPHAPGWQVINSEDLRALCGAAGVPWAEHYAMRSTA